MVCTGVEHFSKEPCQFTAYYNVLVQVLFQSFDIPDVGDFI